MIKKFILLIMCVGLLTQCQSWQTLSLEKNIPFDSQIKIGKLNNGLRYYIAKNNTPKDHIYIRLVVNAGSMHEEEDQKGVAHLVEHMAFNGTKKFPQNEIIVALEKLGMKFARDINAFTDFENTVYTLNIIKPNQEKLVLAFDVIDQWINHLTILPSDLAAEKGVVLEEWRSRLSPMLRLANQKSIIEMEGSRYIHRDPIGDPKIIQHISRQRVYDFYKKWYRPDNMNLIIVGDIDENNIINLLENQFSRISTDLPPLEEINFNIPLSNSFIVKSISEPEMNNMSIEFSFLQHSKINNNYDEYKRNFIKQITIRLVNKRLQQWEKQQKIESANFHQNYLGKETLQSIFSLQLSKPEYISKIQSLFQFIAVINKYGFSTSEFNQEIKNLIYLNQNEYTKKRYSMSLANDLITATANNQVIINPNEKYKLNKKLLSKVTLNDVNQAFRDIINIDSKLMLITQPYLDKKIKLDRSKIELLWKEILQRTTKNWNQSYNYKLIPQINIKEGNITSKKTWKDLGITEYSLSNGRKLIYFYSNKIPKQIYFKAITKGGLRSLENAEYHQMRIAASLVDETGIGDLSNDDIGMLFKNNPILFSTLLDDYHQGFIAKGHSENFDDLMKLFLLRLTSSKISEESLEKYKMEMTKYFNLMDQDIKFIRHVSKLRFNKNETIYSLNKNIIHNLNKIELEKTYQKTINNKTDFDYFIVGDITPEKVEKIAKKYLSTIKAKTELRTYKKIDIHIPQKEYILTGLKEPRAEVELYFTNSIAWDKENEYLLDILAAILQEKLRIILREKASGVYSVNSWFMQEPEMRQADGKIEFSCAPERIEQLLTLTNQVINEIIEKGVEIDLLNKKISEKISQIALQEENLFVQLDLIEKSYRYFDNPKLLYLQKQINRIVTKEKIDNLAKKCYQKMGDFMQY